MRQRLPERSFRAGKVVVTRAEFAALLDVAEAADRLCADLARGEVSRETQLTLASSLARLEAVKTGTAE